MKKNYYYFLLEFKHQKKKKQILIFFFPSYLQIKQALSYLFNDCSFEIMALSLICVLVFRLLKTEKDLMAKNNPEKALGKHIFKTKKEKEKRKPLINSLKGKRKWRTLKKKKNNNNNNNKRYLFVNLE